MADRLPPPEEERRGPAVRLACQVLISAEVRFLPPDPFALARDLGFHLLSLSAIAEELQQNPDQYIRHTVGEEAFTLSLGEQKLIIYNDTVRSPERIRFSIFHEFGHLLLRHFDCWNLARLSPDQARALEDEANTFARNFLCPPPILDLVRGDRADPKLAALFCMSQRAWSARLRTMAIDRRYIDQPLADQLRDQFRPYMFGRRCRDCGHVFIDEFRQDRCPQCGCRYLSWNPLMESRLQAAAHQHVAGTRAEDIKPASGAAAPDLTRYWELLRQEQ